MACLVSRLVFFGKLVELVGGGSVIDAVDNGAYPVYYQQLVISTFSSLLSKQLKLMDAFFIETVYDCHGLTDRYEGMKP